MRDRKRVLQAGIAPDYRAGNSEAIRPRQAPPGLEFGHEDAPEPPLPGLIGHSENLLRPNCKAAGVQSASRLECRQARRTSELRFAGPTNYMETNPEVGLLACQYEDMSSEGRRLGTGRRSRWLPGTLTPRQMTDAELDTPFVSFFCATGQGPFALYRRSIYIKTEGWDTSFWPHEDTDMFCQMALLGKVHCLPARLYLKRIHPAQGMNDWARVQQAYSSFRTKWDNRVPRTADEVEILNKARVYYYSVHRPFRDLKVAARAFLEFVQCPELSSLRWALKCLRSALYGMVVYRIYLPKTTSNATRPRGF